MPLVQKLKSSGRLEPRKGPWPGEQPTSPKTRDRGRGKTGERGNKKGGERVGWGGGWLFDRKSPRISPISVTAVGPSMDTWLGTIAHIELKE